MRKTLGRWLTLLVVTIALFSGGCSSREVSQASPESPAPTQTISPTPSTTQASSPQAVNLPRLEGKATVAMVVKGGTVTIEVDGTNAPITAGNFVDLVQRGVYNGLVFHRVERDPQPFVVQGGDPQSKNPNFPPEQLGTGSYVDQATSQPRYIPLEIKPQGAATPIYSQTFEMAGVSTRPALRHTRGAVAMARSMLPDSASSQFYFALSDLNMLDGSYAVFGYVTQGMNLVDKIQPGDRIESAKVTQGADNLKTAGKS